MEVMWIVLPLALLFAAGAVGVFAWAVKTGQFDDLVTPSHRVLLDDEEMKPEAAGVQPPALTRPHLPSAGTDSRSP